MMNPGQFRPEADGDFPEDDFMPAAESVPGSAFDHPGLGTDSPPADNFTSDPSVLRFGQDRAAEEVKDRLFKRPNPSDTIAEARERAAKEEARRREMQEQRQKKDQGRTFDELVTEKDRLKMDLAMASIAKKNRDLVIPKVADNRTVINEANAIDGSQFAGAPYYGEDVMKECHDVIADCERSFSGNNDKAVGPVMEKLAMALICKYFPGQMCAATWKFDDYRNGVDNVFFVDGEAVVAFDEVVGGKREMHGNETTRVRENKKAKIRASNAAGGAQVKFCMRKDEKSGNFVLMPESNLPVIKVDLNPKAMEQAIKGYNPDGLQNDQEGCAIYCIIKTFYDQIWEIKKMIAAGGIKFGYGAAGSENRERFIAKLNKFKALLEAEYPEEKVEKKIQDLNFIINGRRPKRQSKKRK